MKRVEKKDMLHSCLFFRWNSNNFGIIPSPTQLSILAVKSVFPHLFSMITIDRDVVEATAKKCSVI